MAKPSLPSSSATQQSAAYPDAAVRGKLRHWKERLARRYQSVNRAMQNPAIHSAVADFCSKNSREGRRRAFDKVARGFGDGVTLEGLRIDGNLPLAVWSILKPRDSVLQNEAGEPAGQDCITIDYVMAGIMPAQDDGRTYRLADGLWSLEIPDHAAGRVLHRAGDAAALPSIIAEAHGNLLRVRTRDLVDGDNKIALAAPFLLRAGPGGFVCELFVVRDVSIGSLPGIYAKVHTWLGEDMLHDDQVMLVPDGEEGERLVDGWLLPKPVRRIVPANSSGLHQVVSWVPGLPNLLISPKGRA